jgi:hypothetical protein
VTTRFGTPVTPIGPKFALFDRVTVAHTTGVTVIGWVRGRQYDLAFKSWTYLLHYEGIPGRWFIPEKRLALSTVEI